MLTSKLVLSASLLLAAAGAFADTGDLSINDWATSSPSVTREQVKAELREAIRLGLVSVGESGPPIATPEQERLIAKAGKDAADAVAKSRDDADEG